LFSPGTHVSSTNKTDRHDIAEILLTVALNTITLTLIRIFPTVIISVSIAVVYLHSSVHSVLCYCVWILTFKVFVNDFSIVLTKV